MIDGLKPYPQYKDSGVPWLGKMPAHWEVFPNRALFVEINDQNHPNEQLLSVTINSGVIQQRELLNVSSKKDSSRIDKSNYKLVMPGDIVYNKMRAWQGAIGLSQYRGIVSPAYVVQKPKYQESGRFFHYLFRTPLFIKEAERWSYGITSDMWSLRPEHFKLIYSPLPPLPEQQAIVQFLDWAEQRIRKAIRLRQRRIKLLQEYKQALIHQAVTGQIDVRTGQPYPEYKDSGVEWLGKVPKHWEVVPLKRAFISMDYGISDTSSDSGTIRLLTMGHINSGRISIPDSGGVNSVDPNLLLSCGDLLFNRTNSADLVAKVGLFEGHNSPVTFASYLVRLRPRSNQEPAYLNLLLNDTSVLSIARREAIPSLHQCNLNPTRYGRLSVALPPKPEQQSILSILLKNIAKIDTAIAADRRAIELLKEFRTTLIAEVVSGKLDVREAATQLPETPESEEEDLAEIEEEPPEPQEEEPLLQEEADA